MPPTRLHSAAAAGTTRCATCVRSARCLVARLGQTEGGDGIVELGVSAGEPVLRQGEPVRHVLAAKVGLLTLRRQGPAGPGRAIGRLQRGERRNIVVLPPVGADAAQPMPDGGLPVARQDTRAADDAINRRFA